jgi:hypothetical protein
VNSDFFGRLDAGDEDWVSDEDWIAVDLIEGQSVRIQVLGQDSGMGTLDDPLFTLYDPQASEIGRYDDSNGSFEPDAIVTPAESGTHYIAVSGYDESPGTYSLVVTDLLASLRTASSMMSVNSDFFGTLDAGDEDWIAVDLIEGQSVRIQVQGQDSGMGTLNDPLFTLYDPRANEIGFYDDSETSLDPDAIVTPEESGTHYIAVSGFFGSTGTYSLVVTAAETVPAVSSGADGLASYREQGDAANGPETQAVMSVNSDFSGTLDAGDEDWVSDEDWIAVDLIEGQSVRIQVLGAESEMGRLEDPLFTLYNPQASEIGFYDDSDNGSLEPDAIVTPAESGTHYIAVSGFFGSTGTYSLVVTAASSAVAASSQPGSAAAELALEAPSGADGLASYSEQGDAQAGVGSDAEMTIGSEFLGLIDPGDEDWIGVELSAGEAVRIQVQGQDSGMGSLSDPVLSLYHPVNGLLGRYDDSNESLDPDTVFTPKQSDLYYLSVSGYEGTNGTYRVTLVPAL